MQLVVIEMENCSFLHRRDTSQTQKPIKHQTDMFWADKFSRKEHTHKVKADPLESSDSSFWFAYHIHIFKVVSRDREEGSGGWWQWLSGVHGDSLSLSLCGTVTQKDADGNMPQTRSRTHTHYTHGWLTAVLWGLPVWEPRGVRQL